MTSLSKSSRSKPPLSEHKFLPAHGHTHGGQLTQASQQYGIPLDDWIDLSTGINPFAYPLAPVPEQCWQRLPEANDGLELAAAEYYGSDYLLPVSGSQEAIQALPLLFASLSSSPLNIGIVTPAYHSHQQAWEKAGHTVVLLSHDEIEHSIPSLDVLLLINPSNPSCLSYSREILLKWHQQLANQNSTLVVDEAFIDSTPNSSLIEATPKQGLIVLRSIGKFFGLAGIRLGFVWAESDILQRLSEYQDDWSVSHPARWAGKTALKDTAWQQQQRDLLRPLSLRLTQLLDTFLISYSNLIRYNREKQSAKPQFAENPLKGGGVAFIKHTTLFVYCEHSDAQLIHQSLAKKGILTRLFIESKQQKNALRFGLPADEKQWQCLQHALNDIIRDLSFENAHD